MNKFRYSPLDLKKSEFELNNIGIVAVKLTHFHHSKSASIYNTRVNKKQRCFAT